MDIILLGFLKILNLICFFANFSTSFALKSLFSSFIDKRVSFYYSADLYKNGILFDIIEISENDKQKCLCHNHEQGNYNLTTIRLAKN